MATCNADSSEGEKVPRDEEDTSGALTILGLFVRIPRALHTSKVLKWCKTGYKLRLKPARVVALHLASCHHCTALHMRSWHGCSVPTVRIWVQSYLSAQNQVCNPGIIH